MEKLKMFKQGILEELPLQLGVFPFGIVYGVMAIEGGLNFLQSFLLSSIIFGGASQIVFIQLISSFTPAGIIISSVGAINSRHFLYGMSIMPYLRELSLTWRVVLAYLLTDEAYAISIKKFTNDPNNSFLHYHLLGTGITLFITWQISTLTGILLGKHLPEFIAIVMPMISSISILMAALSSGFSALIFNNLDLNLWIILSALIGLIVGIATSRFDK
jgi:predicted branched-subunit amino acid permease